AAGTSAGTLLEDTSLAGILAGDISPATTLALAVLDTQIWRDIGLLALPLLAAELPSLTMRSAAADWIDSTASVASTRTGSIATPLAAWLDGMLGAIIIGVPDGTIGAPDGGIGKA